MGRQGKGGEGRVRYRERGAEVGFFKKCLGTTWAGGSMKWTRKRRQQSTRGKRGVRKDEQKAEKFNAPTS
jgi:hypothetical protein